MAWTGTGSRRPSKRPTPGSSAAAPFIKTENEHGHGVAATCCANCAKDFPHQKLSLDLIVAGDGNVVTSSDAIFKIFNITPTPRQGQELALCLNCRNQLTELYNKFNLFTQLSHNCSTIANLLELRLDRGRRSNSQQVQQCFLTFSRPTCLLEDISFLTMLESQTLLLNSSSVATTMAHRNRKCGNCCNEIGQRHSQSQKTNTSAVTGWKYFDQGKDTWLTVTVLQSIRKIFNLSKNGDNNNGDNNEGIGAIELELELCSTCGNRLGDLDKCFESFVLLSGPESVVETMLRVGALALAAAVAAPPRGRGRKRRASKSDEDAVGKKIHCKMNKNKILALDDAGVGLGLGLELEPAYFRDEADHEDDDDDDEGQGGWSPPHSDDWDKDDGDWEEETNTSGRSRSKRSSTSNSRKVYRDSDNENEKDDVSSSTRSRTGTARKTVRTSRQTPRITRCAKDNKEKDNSKKTSKRNSSSSKSRSSKSCVSVAASTRVTRVRVPVARKSCNSKKMTVDESDHDHDEEDQRQEDVDDPQDLDLDLDLKPTEDELIRCLDQDQAEAAASIKVMLRRMPGPGPKAKRRPRGKSKSKLSRTTNTKSSRSSKTSNDNDDVDVEVDKIVKIKRTRSHRLRTTPYTRPERTYTCPHPACDRTFRRQGTFSYHLVSHSGVKTHACTFCPKIFLHRYQLTIHTRRHTGDKRYTCELCGKAFVTLCALKIHAFTHTAEAERPFKCPLCPEVAYSRKVHLDRHTLYVHVNNDEAERAKNLECPEGLRRPNTCEHAGCGKAFISATALTHHRSVAHEGVKPYTCEICGNGFLAGSSLKEHILSLHSKVKRFKCEVCQKPFTRKSEIRRHLRTHSGEKPFECEICGRSFASRSNRTAHLLTHRDRDRDDDGDRDRDPAEVVPPSTTTKVVRKRYGCDKEGCGKSYAKKPSLVAHQSMHEVEEAGGLKPFKCDVCWRSFGRGDLLTQHAKVHKKEKRFVCPTCGKAFSQSVNRTTHMKTHSGDKGHVCEVCGKGFTTKQQMQVHQKKH